MNKNMRIKELCNPIYLDIVSRAKKKCLRCADFIATLGKKSRFYKTLRERTTETFRAKTDGHGTIWTNNEIYNFLIQT